MPKISEPLTDAAIRRLRPQAKPFKTFDGGGLFIVTTANGAKLWRLAYRINGATRTKSLGIFPAVTLPQARGERERIKGLVRDGIDPDGPRAVTGRTFKAVAAEWHRAQSHRWTPAYGVQVWDRIEADILPDLGQRPIADIGRAEMLGVLQKVEARGVLETSRRLKQYCSAIFRYAAASDDKQGDPTLLLKGALKVPPRAKHHKALRRDEIGPFFINAQSYDGIFVGNRETGIALQLALLTAVRTGELIGARWGEFERLDEPERALWRIPAERMKMREEHLVPLAPQVVTLLKKLGPGGRNEFVFPDDKGGGGHMSNNTMLFACYRMGYRGRLTVHGFRRTFSTEANEHGWPPEHVELQLAHDDRDKVRSAYNSAKHLEGRRQLMRWWASYACKLREDARWQKRTNLFDQAPRFVGAATRNRAGPN